MVLSFIRLKSPRLLRKYRMESKLVEVSIKPRPYLAKLSGVRELYSGVKSFTFEFEEEFYFRPGQFVVLETKDDGENLIRRSYSIASRSGERLIELVMNILPDGKMTKILDGLELGSEIKLIGPYGKFGEGASDLKDGIVFIVAGTGIVPVKCVLDSLFASGFRRKITLLYGFRHESHFLFERELNERSKKDKNFELVPSISRPENPKKCKELGWKVGRVTDFIEGYSKENSSFFICGLSQMVKDVKKRLLTSGVASEKIHVEIW